MPPSEGSNHKPLGASNKSNILPNNPFKKQKIEKEPEEVSAVAALGQFELERYSLAVETLTRLYDEQAEQLTVEDLVVICDLYGPLVWLLQIHGLKKDYQNLYEFARKFINNKNIENRLSENYEYKYAWMQETFSHEHIKNIDERPNTEAIAPRSEFDLYLEKVAGHMKLSQFDQAIKELKLMRRVDQVPSKAQIEIIIMLYLKYSKNIVSCFNQTSQDLQYEYGGYLLLVKDPDFHTTFEFNKMRLLSNQFYKEWENGNIPAALKFFILIHGEIKSNEDFISYYSAFTTHLYDISSDNKDEYIALFCDLQRIVPSRHINQKYHSFHGSFYFNNLRLYSSRYTVKIKIEHYIKCAQYALLQLVDDSNDPFRNAIKAAQGFHLYVSSIRDLIETIPEQGQHIYKAQLNQLVNEKQDGLSHFQYIDIDLRTLNDWHYIDHKNFTYEDWKYLAQRAIAEIQNYRANQKTLPFVQQSFENNMQHLYFIITDSMDNLYPNTYEGGDAQMFHEKNPYFLLKFLNLVTHQLTPDQLKKISSSDTKVLMITSGVNLNIRNNLPLVPAFNTQPTPSYTF